MIRELLAILHKGLKSQVSINNALESWNLRPGTWDLGPGSHSDPHAGGFVLHWAPDGRALLYIGTRLSNIWSQPVDGAEPVQLTDIQGDQVFNFDYSPDGKWLALARGRVTDDVVLIEDSK